MSFKIAVLVPCHNEAKTVDTVIRDFKKALPDAVIYVYDNNSTDDTAAKAAAAGAVVRPELLQGKGNVVRRMFADVEADIYIMVDGDATYDASVSPQIVDLVRKGYDIVNVARDSTDETAYRTGHQFGNWFLTSLVSWLFGKQTSDMLSGYKGFSRRFVKSFPAISAGFEIETELTIHALELRVSVGEIRAPYFERPDGSESKLGTIRDGIKIARMIAFFVKNEKPFLFFGAVSLIIFAISMMLGISIVVEFLETGLVPRFPTAILSVSLGIIAVLVFFAGLILETITLGRKEVKRLKYLEYRNLGDDSVH